VNALLAEGEALRAQKAALTMRKEAEAVSGHNWSHDS